MLPLRQRISEVSSVSVTCWQPLTWKKKYSCFLPGWYQLLYLKLSLLFASCFYYLQRTAEKARENNTSGCYFGVLFAIDSPTKNWKVDRDAGSSWRFCRFCSRSVWPQRGWISQWANYAHISCSLNQTWSFAWLTGEINRAPWWDGCFVPSGFAPLFPLTDHTWYLRWILLHSPFRAVWSCRCYKGEKEQKSCALYICITHWEAETTSRL